MSELSTPSSPAARATGPLAAFVGVGLAVAGLAAVHLEVPPGAGHALGAGLPLWTVAPFALLLLAIALAPLAVPHRWESHRVKGLVCGALAAPVALYLVAGGGLAGLHELVEKGREYLSFLLLLGALYVIAGGIFVRGSLSGTPLANTGLLGIGALLASVIGTTGASMVLVRPLLRANASREKKAHLVVFFIFIVSNCGGLLTPLGDPPLFLGFLRGVPFEWTLLRLWAPWLVVNFALLLIFQVIDQAIFNAEEKRRPGAQLEEVMVHEPLRLEGKVNLALLFGVVATVFAAGRGLFHGGEAWPFGVQEGLMLLLAGASLVLTPRAVHAANRFGYGPIVEVAVLFAGIFVTMAPALLLLNHHGPTLGLTRPWQFFWATGALSSFLDNAPTYLTFAATASGLQGVALEGRYLAQLLEQPAGAALLTAISTGAVLMGANTYIGNGPNFMVKAIAEEGGVKMPSFFGYMAWSAAVLLPLFVGVTLLFFRG